MAGHREPGRLAKSETIPGHKGKGRLYREIGQEVDYIGKLRKRETTSGYRGKGRL